jgi:PAS domain S-box-containing protein
MVNIHDTEGNILDVNQRFVEKTGYAKSELTEMKVWDLDANITPEAARTLWQEMEPDDRRQLEGVYQCRDGSTVPVEVHVRRLDVEDKDLFLVISRDVTEQIERERELSTQNERLEEFASIVSHDLRSPLAVAEGHLELAGATDENEHLAKAADALERSQTLIDDLLTLAREGEHVDEIEQVDLAEIAQSGWQTTETQSATLDASVTQTIQADRSRLQQLFENLYRNAVEHGGKDVTVSVGVIDDGFYVADTGAGIVDSEHEVISEAGYSTNEEGTGFGLRIVEQIAEAHGWEITVTESEQGGARFEVTGVERTD